MASSNNLCSGQNGTFSTEKRFADFFQSIGTSKVYQASLITDFQYNIITISEGNSK
jgi:hypothetical protein